MALLVSAEKNAHVPLWCDFADTMVATNRLPSLPTATPLAVEPLALDTTPFPSAVSIIGLFSSANDLHRVVLSLHWKNKHHDDART
jgi:hypothetical protein